MHRMIVALLMALACSCATRQDDSPASSTPSKPETAASNAPEGSIKVMTYNLRYASATPPNAWWQRRPVVKQMLQEQKPDLIGTQEGLFAQLKDIAQDLGPEYDWIGLGREGGSRGEFMAIFYRKQRFEPLQYDHFWLSDTPNVIGSASWGNRVRRMVTWVRFLDRDTKKEFYFWNTHFDHQVQGSREKSAQLVRQRVEALKTPLPVILVGDFNAKAKENKAYQILTEGDFFTDTYTADEAGTYHDFTGTPTSVGRIDWILLHGPVKAVAPTRIIQFSQNGQYPSDHFPVTTRVQIEAPAPTR